MPTQINKHTRWFKVIFWLPHKCSFSKRPMDLGVMCWKKLEDGQRSEVLKLLWRKLQVNQLIYHVQSLGCLPYQLVDFWKYVFHQKYVHIYICICVSCKKTWFFLHVSSQKKWRWISHRGIFWCQSHKAPWRFQPGPLLCEGVENSMIGWEP